MIFTDSLCVLHWLKTEKPLSPFITNRLNEIKTLNDVTFKHVPTEDNAADMATRGKPPNELSSMWWNGPTWLSLPIQQWPNSKTPELNSTLQQQFEVELKGRTTMLEHELVAGENSFNSQCTTLEDINEKKYSSTLQVTQSYSMDHKICGQVKKKRLQNRAIISQRSATCETNVGKTHPSEVILYCN